LRITLMVEALAPQLSGIGRYCWELAKGIPLQNEVENVRYRRNGEWITDLHQLMSSEVAPAARSPKFMRGLRKTLDKSQLRKTIVHGPNYFLPKEAERGVITVHDLSIFKFPETHPVARIRQFERDFQSSIDRATKVITDSEAVRQELISFCNIPQDRISAVPLGFDPRFRPYREDELSEFLSHHGLQYGQYGLCVSALEPRKKISQLLSAWRALKPKIRAQYPLVLVGPKGWLNDDLNDQINRGANEGWLRYLGFLSEEKLPLIYAGAALFVYPSIYEGFGLPTLEAMASGVPLIVADHACAREICAAAATYINPDDQEAFISAIYKNLEDASWRELNIENGLQRSSNYSWSKCISETVDLYREIGNH
jgi:glycosyltransferase involved in cell wall biosynthesis